jgi:membrane protease subunit HflK
MPNQGGWTGGRGPWSQGPQGGGSSTPDLEDLLRRGQDRFRRILPRRLGSGGFGLIILAAVALWLLSGFYVVRPGERGVETRFGRFTQETKQGLNYHLPYPIESVRTPNVDFVNRVEVGFHSASESGREQRQQDVPEESLMLTGDENIVDVDFGVLWNIKSAPDFLFNVKDPEQTVKAVAESAMREIVGQSRIDQLQTEERTDTQDKVRDLIERTLDSYGAGINIVQVQMQKVDPPEQVIESFRDVQAARADKERAINEALAYRNKVVPEARGKAEQIRQEAQAYREQTVAQAQGEAQRFTAVLAQYQQAKTVTRERMYLETMERVLGRIDKVVIDEKSTSGVVPYLPLDALKAPKGTVQQGGELTGEGGNP